MLHRLALLLAVSACASKPPHGPSHVPANSPEPQTQCAEARTQAKTARDDLLEHGTVSAREAAARQVLTHAECELAVFAKMTIPRSAQEPMLGEIRILRDQYFTTRNLLDEVIAYDVSRVVIGGMARLGDLEDAYARKLADVPAPTDLQPEQAQGFRDELAEMGREFAAQARFAYAGAIDLAGNFDGHDEELRNWVATACSGLARLDTEAYRRRAACPR